MSQIFNLSKDNPTFDLSKDSPNAISEMVCGLGWKTKMGRDVDLDLSVIVVDAASKVVETASFSNAKRNLLGGAMYHFGDDLTGSNAQTDMDNEQVRLKLSDMPPSVTAVWVMGSVYSGDLKNVKSCYVCVRGSDTQKLVNADMSDMSGTAIMLAKIVRDGNGWKVERVDGAMNARTASSAVGYINGEKSFGSSDGNQTERRGFFSRLLG